MKKNPKQHNTKIPPLSLPLSLTTLAAHGQQSDRWECISSASGRWPSEPGRGWASPRGFYVSVKCHIPRMDEQNAPNPATTTLLYQPQHVARMTRKRRVIHGDKFLLKSAVILDRVKFDDGAGSVKLKCEAVAFPSQTDALLNLPYVQNNDYKLRRVGRKPGVGFYRQYLKIQ